MQATGGNSAFTLLLLGGEADSCMELREGLEVFGYRVFTAVGLQEFHDVLDQQAIDAILVDLDHPDQETAALWMKDVKTCRPFTIPVMVLSGSVDVQLQLEAVRAGCNAYFVKPLDLQVVADKLDALLMPPEAEPYRILVVEDSRTQSTFLQRLLERASMVTWVVNAPLEALEVMSEFRPDLILMDLYMPGCGGQELAALIRLNPAYLSVPIVFLSMETDEDKQLDALRQGADDFLTKNIRPDRLIASVRIRAERTRLLRSLMLKDSLTGLLNHTTLTGRLQEEIVRAARKRFELCFTMIDLDHFKSVNDLYGHPVGDRVLVSLSSLLLRRLRRNDVVGRYGGEEFGVVLPDTSVEEAHFLIDNLRNAFQALPHKGNRETFHVTFSAGIALWDGKMDASTLIEAADAALYMSKRQGRNCVVLA